MTNTLRLLFAPVLCATLMSVAGCTTTPDRNPRMMMADAAANHPIRVEPSYRSLRINFSAGGLSNGDDAQLDAFVSDYMAHGNGSIAVSAPATPIAHDALNYLAGRINQMGISSDKILVATHDAPQGDTRVELNYVTYEARTDKCGDWSDNLAFTLDNATPKNFGCSVQQNMAAMIADPRDLLGPRTMGESDGARRTTVLGLYEQGKITAADKRKSDLANEQSGVSSTQQ